MFIMLLFVLHCVRFSTEIFRQKEIKCSKPQQSRDLLFYNELKYI